jgi:hypothetical protein
VGVWVGTTRRVVAVGRTGALDPARVGTGPTGQATRPDTGEPGQQRQRRQQQSHAAGHAEDHQQSAAATGGVDEHRFAAPSWDVHARRLLVEIPRPEPGEGPA